MYVVIGQIIVWGLIGLTAGIFLSNFILFLKSFGYHGKKPWTVNVLSSYDHERNVKLHDDLVITRLIGISWKDKWFFGLTTFKKDEDDVC